MDEKDRYSVPENEDYEPGSNQEVLKNLLGIKNKKIMEHVEESELERVGLELLDLYNQDYQFSSFDIKQIHELWLSDIYPFAGQYRSVNMSKGDFQFAASAFIENLMHDLDKQFLQRYTPCQFNGDNLTEALGVVHVELIIIHPFREGNGRVSRLLANLMASQAGYPMLNFSPIDKTKTLEGFNRYIEAIHAGFSGSYEPIKKVFKRILEMS